MWSPPGYGEVSTRAVVLGVRRTHASRAFHLLLAAVVLSLVPACTSDLPPDASTTPTADRVSDAGVEPTPLPSTPLFFDVVSVADAYGRFDEPGARFNSWPHMQWLGFCAQAFGFETTIENIPGSPAGLTAHVSQDQLERWAQVDAMCTEEAVRRGWVIPQPRSPEERRAEYRYRLGVNECLAELGYGTDPPSEDAFVEGTEWDVYANTPYGGQISVAPGAPGGLPPDVVEQLDVQERCPAW